MEVCEQAQMKRLVIYHAVSNAYDKPIPPKGLERFPDIDYVVIAGAVEKSKAALWNRYWKIKRPPENSMYSLYLDGNISPRIELDAILAWVDLWLVDADMAICKHAARKCAYVEIEACIGRNKIDHKQAEAAHEILASLNHPKNFGLWECGIIARRCNVPWVTDLQDRWFRYVEAIPRDQIFLPQVLREVPPPAKRFKTLDMDVRANELFTFRKHNR